MVSRRRVREVGAAGGQEGPSTSTSGSTATTRRSHSRRGGAGSYGAVGRTRGNRSLSRHWRSQRGGRSLDCSPGGDSTGFVEARRGSGFSGSSSGSVPGSFGSPGSLSGSVGSGPFSRRHLHRRPRHHRSTATSSGSAYRRRSAVRGSPASSEGPGPSSPVGSKDRGAGGSVGVVGDGSEA